MPYQQLRQRIRENHEVSSVVIHDSILLTMQRIIHIFLLLFRSAFVMTQVFPNNSENAIPLAYPTNCQVVSGIKTRGTSAFAENNTAPPLDQVVTQPSNAEILRK